MTDPGADRFCQPRARVRRKRLWGNANGRSRGPSGAVALALLLLIALAIGAPPARAQSDEQSDGQSGGQSDGQSGALQAPALIAALDRTVLAAELTASLSAFPKRPGESFDKGDILVRFSCKAFEAQRDVGRADVAAASAQLRVKRRLFELQSAGAMDVELAEAGLRKAEAQVRLYQVQVDRCAVRAPYKGRVVEWLAQPHSSVETGAELMEIVGVERLEVEAIVPSTWLKWIEPGTRFTVEAEETRAPIAATVRRIGAVVDPASQTVVIRGSIDGANGTLLPGMRGRATFDRKDAS